MFNGSLVALVTPFNEAGGIDFPALRKLVDFHLDSGTAGLIIAGTTGESVSLTVIEFGDILDRVVEQVAGRIPVIAGTGSASTMRSVEQTKLAARHGVDGALVVTPYYNRPAQRGLEGHFRAVADSSRVPVILYNVPGRTGVDILPETVEQLATHEMIVGIKEAVGQSSRVDELVARCDKDFLILSGDDHTCLEAMRHGASGVISVAANVIPAHMAALCMAVRETRFDDAETLNAKLITLFDVLMIETNPIPVKWALFEMNLLGPHIRLPMTLLDQSLRDPVRQCLQSLELIST
jgi:4-hydroxy-tetrahydrodipicolinate synthase